MRFEPVRDGKISGIKSTGKREKLTKCNHCNCNRYTPCGCGGAVKAREAKTASE